MQMLNVIFEGIRTSFLLLVHRGLLYRGFAVLDPRGTISA